MAMTHDDAIEASRLLLLAGVPKDKITDEALVLADVVIKDMNKRLARTIAEKLFPERIGEPAHSPSQRINRSRCDSDSSE